MPTLSQALRSKLQPWTLQDPTSRFIVAQSKMRTAHLPPSVKLTRRRISGRRVVVKNLRNFNNTRNIIAHWPEDGLHEVNKYTLVCVLDGYIDYQLGNYRLQCGPGHFIFLPPGIPRPEGVQTYVDLQRSTSCDIITFQLHPDAVECWMSHGHPRGREISNFCFIVNERVVSLFEMLMQEVISTEESSPEIHRGLLTVFIKILQREVDAGHFQSVPFTKQYPGDRKKSSQGDFLTRLQHYIKSNLYQKLTLDVVAREMYLSPTHFTRVVRRETGMSFNEYLASYRIQEAKRLLLNTPWTAAMIAKYVGFNSPTYFCTFFKRYTGQSPAEFRASH